MPVNKSGGYQVGAFPWTLKSAVCTAVAGDRILVDTSGGAFTINLPINPSVGNQVELKDYTGSFNTNSLTVGRNGENIRGNAADLVLDYNYAEVVLVFTGVTEGWLYYIGGDLRWKR